MSHFATQLTASIERSGYTRTTFADASGVAYGSLTNYALDRKRAGPAAVAAICRALPRAEAAACLVARLRDEMPAEHADLVMIEPRLDLCTEESAAPYGTTDLPADLREAITKLTRAATLHRDWRDLILDLAKVCDPSG